MKRMICLLLALIMVLGLAACGGSKEPAAQKPDENQIKVEPTAAPTEAPTTPPTEAPTEPEPDLYWVCAIGGLNVRSGPGKDYSVVGTIDDGEVVEPIRWVDGWVYIESPKTGWCSADYLHPLGWYNDVQLPVGSNPESALLTGKWLHATEPETQGNRRRTRIGVLELRRDGTFTHSVSEFISYTNEWKLAEDEYTRPQWVGEYQFDGKTLTLNYLASVDISYDRNGNPASRQYFSATYILELPVTMTNDSLRFTIPNGEFLPCFEGYGTSPTTRNTLYRLPNSISFPGDVCDTLKRWFS